MFELIQVSGNSYYIQSPAKIGLVRLTDTHVCLIDSGATRMRDVRSVKSLDEKPLAANGDL